MLVVFVYLEMYPIIIIIIIIIIITTIIIIIIIIIIGWQFFLLKWNVFNF